MKPKEPVNYLTLHIPDTSIIEHSEECIRPLTRTCNAPITYKVCVELCRYNGLHRFNLRIYIEIETKDKMLSKFNGLSMKYDELISIIIGPYREEDITIESALNSVNAQLDKIECAIEEYIDEKSKFDNATKSIFESIDNNWSHCSK